MTTLISVDFKKKKKGTRVKLVKETAKELIYNLDVLPDLGDYNVYFNDTHIRSFPSAMDVYDFLKDVLDHNKRVEKDTWRYNNMIKVLSTEYEVSCNNNLFRCSGTGFFILFNTFEACSLVEDE